MPVATTQAPVFGFYQREVVQLLCQSNILLQLQLCWCLLTQLALLYVHMALMLFFLCFKCAFSFFKADLLMEYGDTEILQKVGGLTLHFSLSACLLCVLPQRAFQPIYPIVNPMCLV